jgi:threonine/homoserine/homoserine lactone efflux protein
MALARVGESAHSRQFLRQALSPMLGIHDYWLFVATGLLLNLAPGQDTFYILGSSIAQGRRIGVASALGISAGCIVHTLAAAVGLSAILATSAGAFIVVKLAGAAYLVYLGIRFIMTPQGAVSSSGRIASNHAWKAFGQGIVTNVLNPKVALFFLAFLPQFIDPDSLFKIAAFLALGLTFVATGTAWCLILAVAAARVRGFFARHPKAFARLSQAAGTVFVLLGVRLAVSER